MDSHGLQGTKTTQPCLTGHPVVKRKFPQNVEERVMYCEKPVSSTSERKRKKLRTAFYILK